jgi:hypothetical protein
LQHKRVSFQGGETREQFKAPVRATLSNSSYMGGSKASQGKASQGKAWLYGPDLCEILVAKIDCSPNFYVKIYAEKKFESENK